MLHGPKNNKFATYEDIFNTFVAPKLHRILKINENMPIYLYHKDDDPYYDKNRCVTIKEIEDGLVFFILTLESLKNYKEFFAGNRDKTKEWSLKIAQIIEERGRQNKLYFDDDVFSGDINNDEPTTPANIILKMRSFLERAKNNLNTNEWVKTYAQTFLADDYLVNNSSDSSTNNMVLGVRKWRDATITSRAIINNVNDLTIKDISEIILHAIFKPNLDTLLIPITLTNIIDTTNNEGRLNTFGHKPDNALVSLTDLVEIGNLKIKRGVFNDISSITDNQLDFLENTDDDNDESNITTKSYEYDDYLSLTQLSELIKFNDPKLINDDENKTYYNNLFKHIKDLNNAYNIESLYYVKEHRYTEVLNYTLSEIAMTTRQNFSALDRSNFSNIISSVSNPEKTSLLDTVKKNKQLGISGFNYKPETRYTGGFGQNINNNYQDNIIASSADDVDLIGGETAKAKTVTGITTTRKIKPAAPASVMSFNDMFAYDYIEGDSTNMKKRGMILGNNNKITLANLQYATAHSMLADAGAYIVPFKTQADVIDDKTNILHFAYAPLTINAIVNPNHFNWLLPVFNGPNYNPGKRGAVFTIKQDITETEAQIMVEQFGPPVIITLTNFDDNFDKTLEYYKNENALVDDIISVQLLETPKINSKELQNSFIITKIVTVGSSQCISNGDIDYIVNNNSNIQKIEISIKYDEFNLSIPPEFKYIKIGLDKHFLKDNKVPSVNMDINVQYYGITVDNRTWNRDVYLIDTKKVLTDTYEPNKPGELLYQYWLNNRTANDDGDSIGLEKLIGESPNIWEQNNILIIPYIDYEHIDDTADSVDDDDTGDTDDSDVDVDGDDVDTADDTGDNYTDENNGDDEILNDEQL